MRYFVFLNPYTFLWHNKETALLYNSLSGRGDTLVVNDEILNILMKFDDIEEMYCVYLEDELVNSSVIKSFIEKIYEYDFGGIINLQNDIKPIIIPPQSVILNKPHKTSEYLRYLKKITIALNSYGSVYPYTKDSNIDSHSLNKYLAQSISWQKLEILLKNLPPNLEQLVITGINPLMYGDWRRLEEKVILLPSIKILVLNYKAFHNMITSGFKIDSSFNIEVEIITPFLSEEIEELILNANRYAFQIKYIFYVTSIKECEFIERIIKNHSSENIEIKPWFNGSNLHFFEEFVYLTSEDLLGQRLSKREIFAHQLINTNDFGNFTILPSGVAYANIYMSPLGKIDDDLGSMVKKEFIEGKSWFRTRDMVEPCRKCLYRYLCPSLSNYEIQIDKNNLCLI